MLATSDRSLAGSAELVHAEILVIHRDPLYHDLVAAAAASLPAGFRVKTHHAATIEEGLALAAKDGVAMSSIIFEFALVGDVHETLRSFADSSERLQQLIAIAPSDATLAGFDVFQGADAIPCLRESASPGQVIDACRSLLLELKLRCHLLRALADYRALLPSVTDRSTLSSLTSSLLAQVAAFFGIDAVLIPDLKDASGEITAVVTGDDRTRELLKAAIYREHTQRNSSRDAVSRLLSSLTLSGRSRLGIEQVASVSDDSSDPPNVSEFSVQQVPEGQLFVALVTSMHETLVSGLAVASRGKRRFERLMLCELRAFVEHWAKQHVSLTITAIRAKEHEEENRARVSFQESIAEMVCGMSHEINTPLGVIRTAAALIFDHIQELHDAGSCDAQRAEDLSDALGIIDTNIERLARLIDNFKMLAVGQAPEVAVFCSIVDPINAAIERIARADPGLLINRLIDLDAGTDTWIGYPRRFEEVVHQLLENASVHAYRGRGGMVELRMRGRRIDGTNRFSLVVSDFGAGIAAENLPRVFDAFFTTSRLTKATGLGLAIAKSIVTEALLGKIRVESDAGIQTTFTVEFASVPAPAK